MSERLAVRERLKKKTLEFGGHGTEGPFFPNNITYHCFGICYTNVVKGLLECYLAEYPFKEESFVAIAPLYIFSQRRTSL